MKKTRFSNYFECDFNYDLSKEKKLSKIKNTNENKIVLFYLKHV